MKKMIVCVLASLLFMTATYAEETDKVVSPVVFSFSGPDYIDIVGLRLSAWGNCNTLTGVDLTLRGTAVSAYGLQLSILNNDVRDKAAGLQASLLMNTVGDFAGVQIAPWNHNIMTRGLQIGLINISDDIRGFQIGLLNRCEMIYGYQIGLINVIRGSFVPVFPILNFMFNEY